ncbi:MAG TPA: glycoside hydrolase family 30 beta sandwich domain-containing protein [Tepidisphaeraceae bacterium]|jgi:O-glycosyl hydrolase|nr:glycoside hydrolase family 30 beta sandwich domain-containing protein [Tepidisphaeraceae bacterium]
MFPSRLIVRFAAVVFLPLASSLGWGQTTQPVSITVNQASRFQKIEGFGTALSSDSPVWQPQFLQMYTQDLGSSILRIPLTPDILPNQVTLGPDIQSNINLFNFMGNYPQTNWGQFAAQAVQATGGQMKLIASVWSPPPWMKTTDSQNGGSLIQTSANLTQFARYMAAYVKGFQQTYGVPLYAVSIQNELRFWEPYPSTVYGYGDYVNALNAVGAEFARDGITTKIMGPEDVGVDGGYITAQTMGYINAAKADPTAYSYLGFYAIHGYSGNGTSPGGGEANWASFYQQVAPDGKEIWQTETSGENPAWVHFDSNGNPDGALSVALNMHEALAYGNVNAYVYWQMDDGDHTTTTTTTLTGNLDPTSLKYNAAKHYMKFIRPGAVRVAATPDNLTGISVDAYVEPDNTMTIELINASAYDTPTSIAIPGTNYSSFAEYLTTATQPWAVLPDIAVSGNNSLSLLIPANSVITLQSDGFSLVMPEPSVGLLSVPMALLALKRRRTA